MRAMPIDVAQRGECLILPSGTACVHRLTVVTRTTADVQVFLVALYDPWTFRE